MIRFNRICVLLLLFWSISGTGQTDYNNVPDVTDVILINDVHIYPNPVDSFGIGDILIEGGLIKKVAKEIEAPSNAKVIEADSAHAYACFIDAFGSVGIPKPEGRPERPNVRFPGFPSTKTAGITPEVKASELVKSDEKSIGSMRKIGYGIAHVVPRGRMLPGQGCVISLTGDESEGMILRNESSLLFQFAGARGVYPSTVIAVMSKWRELYKNAELYKKNMDRYSADQAGVPRPKYDEVLSAIVPATQDGMPVFHNASKSKDIYRSLELQKDLGYHMVLADVQQADAAIGTAKEGNVDIILSLDLPKSDASKKGGKGERGSKGSDKGEKAEEQEEDPQLKALKERKEKAVKEYVGQAFRLEEAGLDFAFSSMSISTKDHKSAINKMIESGLSKEAAMSALTVNAAKILGIEKIAGTIEEGKMANIFICTEEYFNEKSDIKYSFVEGDMMEYEIKKKDAPKSGNIDESIYGEWSYTVTIGEDDNTGVLKISDADGEMSIEVIDDDDPENPLEAQNISYNDSVLKFTVVVPMTPEGVEVSLTLEMAQDEFTGDVNLGPMGTADIEGTKRTSPENKRS